MATVRLVGLAGVLALCAACQGGGSGSMSLADARSITASFQPARFSAPPRRIDDIVALVEREKPNSATEQERKRLVAEQPPRDLSGIALARFYEARANAAQQLGRLELAISDFRRARDIARQAGTIDDVRRILVALMNTEGQAGRFKDGLASSQLSRSLATTAGDQTSDYGWDAYANVQIGAIGDAQIALDTATALRDRHELELKLRGEPRWMSWLVANVGSHVALGLGKYDLAAERALEALALHESGEVTRNVSVSLLLVRKAVRDVQYANLARAMMGLGRLAEAEIYARTGLTNRLTDVGRANIATLRVMTALTMVLAAQGRLDEAERLNALALDTYRSMDVAPTAPIYADARHLQAELLAAQGNARGALATLDALGRDLDTDEGRGQRREFYDGSIVRGFALLRAGDATQAQAVLNLATSRYTEVAGPGHPRALEAKGLLAVSHLKLGDVSGALSLFVPAVEGLLQSSRGDAAIDPLSSPRFRLILESYIDLLSSRSAVDADAGERAFLVAEGLRPGRVRQALAASAARAAARDPDLAELARREQDARHQINALFALIAAQLSRPSAERDENVLTGLRREIDLLRDARSALRQEIERRFPDYADLISPRPTSIAEARSRLLAGEALLAILTTETRTYVWATSAGGPTVFKAVPISRADAVEAIARLRLALTPEAATLGDIPAFDVDAAHRLYDMLLAPVSGAWNGQKTLIAVVDAPYSQLPLSLLVTAPHRLQPDREGVPLFSAYRAVPWLAKQIAVVDVPTVSTFIALRRSRAAADMRKAFVGFGDPEFAGGASQSTPQQQPIAQVTATRSAALIRRNQPAFRTASSAKLGQLPRLPETADEVTAVAGALGADVASDVRLGRAASEAAAKSGLLDKRKVVMFATHGLVAGDLDGLTQPAIALSMPEPGSADDGLLTMEEILQLKLDADWVVLSACNTAAADGAGAEAASGLGRAFFYAGTRAMLVSHWPVETTSAKALTVELFTRQATDAALSRSEALRQSMLHLIDGPGRTDASGRTAHSYAHPIFWAPFILLGDGGGEVTRTAGR